MPELLTPQTWDVFLSHSSRDLSRVRQLATALRARGLRVWLAEDSIQIGDSIPMSIEEGLVGSRLLLACFSPAYLSSAWTLDELAAIQYRDPANRDRALIPLILEKCELPPLVSHLKYFDCSNDDDFANAAEQIAKVVNTETQDAENNSAKGEPTHPPQTESTHARTYGPSEKKSVLLVTALPVEREAFRRLLAFSPAVPIKEDAEGVGSDTFEFPGGNRLTLAALDGPGRLSAALTIQRILDQDSFDAVCLIGICAGVGKDVKIGDVVVSDQIVDYGLAKVTDSGTQHRWSAFQSSFSLSQAMRSFEGTSWRWLLEGRLPDGRLPTSHVGTVLSGDMVVASADFVAELLSHWPQAQAIEMEAAGIATALYTRGPSSPDFIMVKAVCDFADSKKQDNYQHAAAMAAAAFAMEFFMQYLSRP